MKCHRKFTASRKKGVVTPAHVCDGDVKCVEVEVRCVKDYCYCDGECGCYSAELSIIYKCSKCNQPIPPITDAYQLVGVINEYLSSR